MKDESSDRDWCSDAHVWVMLSWTFRRTGGGKKQLGEKDRQDGSLSLGQEWANFIRTLICALHLSADCEREGR